MDLYHRILVALDGSPGSLSALDHAVRLAGENHARLYVVTVARRGPMLSECLAASAGLPYVEPTDRLGDELRRALDRIPDDQPVTASLRVGLPAEEIVAFAKEVRADLVVMGSRTHLPLTSVSHHVLHDSPVPVLIVQAPHDAPVAEASPAPAPGAVTA
jgi:nucleotide-binding universal stress UspA family protein